MFWVHSTSQKLSLDSGLCWLSAYQKNRKNKNIRFLRNIDAFENDLRQAIQPPFQLMRVVLEELDFKEQLEVLSNAACLIGQHG